MKTWSLQSGLQSLLLLICFQKQKAKKSSHCLKPFFKLHSNYTYFASWLVISHPESCLNTFFTYAFKNTSKDENSRKFTVSVQKVVINRLTIKTYKPDTQPETTTKTSTKTTDQQTTSCQVQNFSVRFLFLHF